LKGLTPPRPAVTPLRHPGSPAEIPMHVPNLLLAESDLLYVVENATIEGKVIIVILVLFSIFAFCLVGDGGESDADAAGKEVESVF
jgi:hypothetical protein